MALPALEKTWEFDANKRWVVSTTNNETAGEQLSIAIKNLYLGQTHHGLDGTINEIVAGVTYELVATNQAPADPFGASADFDATLIGRTIEIIGATTPANDGKFAVTAVPATNTIRYSNASGVAEAFSGGYKVFNAQFSGGSGGVGSPWICKGSGAGSTGKGAAMDGRDRWLSTADTQSSTSSSGNRSWFCFQNEITGAEWVLEHFSTFGSDEFFDATIRVSPELGFTGGTSTTVPTAVDGVLSHDRQKWLGDGTPANQVWFGNMCISNDGEDTRFFTATAGRVAQMFICDKAKDPITAGPLIVWNGSQNVITWEFVDGGNIMTHGTWNDLAQLRATFDKDGATTGPHLAALYMTSEMLGSAMLGEQYDDHPSDLDDEYPFFNIGLAATTLGWRGRHGRMSDIWFCNGQVSRPPNQGATFPNNTSRQFLKLGHMVVPWNGSLPQLTG
jgi:hypothetical protein